MLSVPGVEHARAPARLPLTQFPLSQTHFSLPLTQFPLSPTQSSLPLTQFSLSLWRAGKGCSGVMCQRLDCPRALQAADRVL